MRYAPAAVVTFMLFAAPPTKAAGPAVVAQINGAPVVTRAGQSTPLQVGGALMIGDVVGTDERSKVRIVFADDSVLAIGPKTQIALDEFVLESTTRKSRLRVLAGRFKIAIAKFIAGSTDYEIRTPTAVAGVRGTILWGDTDLDAICALDGTIEVRTLSGPAAALSTGQCVHEMKSGTVQPLTPSAADLAAYLKEVTLE